MVPSQDSNLRPINDKSDPLPIASLCRQYNYWWHWCSTVKYCYFFIALHCIVFHFLSSTVLFCCTVHYCLFSFLIFSLLATTSLKLNLNSISGRRLRACHTCGRLTTPSVCWQSMCRCSKNQDCVQLTQLCGCWFSCVEQFSSEPSLCVRFFADFCREIDWLIE